ncbi:MAG: FHA domain-containing protein [Sorangiineae bacterium PRO1]|nr:FHA domain-containing protein [Sorangiineae bacterium PRO1]
MVPLDEIPALMDGLVVRSHVNAASVVMGLDRHRCQARIARVLSCLREGAYLIGAGPGTGGIVPLSVDRVVLGRAATPFEEPGGEVVDIQAGDASYLGPHEVSRTHAAVVRAVQNGCSKYFVVDLGSTCGTFVNGKPVSTQGGGTPLASGDVISLGASHATTYLFLER